MSWTIDTLSTTTLESNSKSTLASWRSCTHWREGNNVSASAKLTSSNSDNHSDLAKRKRLSSSQIHIPRKICLADERKRHPYCIYSDPRLLVSNKRLIVISLIRGMCLDKLVLTHLLNRVLALSQILKSDSLVLFQTFSNKWNKFWFN